MSLWNYSDINKKDKRVKNFCRESTWWSQTSLSWVILIAYIVCEHNPQLPDLVLDINRVQPVNTVRRNKVFLHVSCFDENVNRNGLNERGSLLWELKIAPLPGITTLKTYVNVTGSCLVQCSDKQYCSSVYMIVPAILCCRKFLINPNPP